MNRHARYILPLALFAAVAANAGATQPQLAPFTWHSVVDNGDYMPTDSCDPAAFLPTSPPCRNFNSYNQPSVNASGLVVFRARSRGGHGAGEPVHGIYTRDMDATGPVIRILERGSPVSQPNNLGTVFHEPPSFPRIDIASPTIVTRGNHQPVWDTAVNGGIEEQLGTNGVYANPFGPLVTGASKLGAVSDFFFFQVPESPGTYFDVFPGAPAVTDGSVIVFKGNYTIGLVGKTGVYYRNLMDAPIPYADGALLTPAAGTLPVVLIANNTDTLVPGTQTVFGSTAPPSAANHMAVFAGFDNEDAPTLGGIYLAPLNGSQPPLATLVGIGQQVPGENPDARFNRLGEGVSFDGRFVAFWGAWGTAMRTLVLQCPLEGNAQRVAYCQEQFPDGASVQVPVQQGIFVVDIETQEIRPLAKTPADYDDFLYWNFSGHVPGSTEEEDGEPARWRSAAFVAVSGAVHGKLSDPTFTTAFEARTGAVQDGVYVDPVDGIYLKREPGKSPMLIAAETGMAGTRLDARALDAETGAALPITELGIERDGFRGNYLVINARMGAEETGWAGIYFTDISVGDTIFADGFE
ncbi:MAG TPA: hypothetical protein VLB69_10740 [Rudaea sp.]|nr:hypothetical protein [Rudaea sp.]